MQRANHKRWAQILFDFYLNRLYKKNFHRFLIVNEIPVLESDKSILVTPNHFSWWDGFLIYTIYKIYLSNRKFYILMLDDQLKKYKFFNWLGAYSIDKNNKRDYLETVNYTQELLRDSNSFVVFYPEGEINPFSYSGLDLKNGIRKFVNVEKELTQVLSIGFKFQYFNKSKPDIFCKFGKVYSNTDLIGSYDDYKREFVENLADLNESSVKMTFVNKLFESECM